MMKLVLYTFGLMGLSAAAGAALFASHSALAAGPRLPDQVIRAHAVAAAETVAPAKVMSDAVIVPAHWDPLPAPEPEGSFFAEPMISTQSSDFAGLAPVRALRPVARPGAYEAVAQASAQRREAQPAVSMNRRAPLAVAAEPASRRVNVVREVVRTRPAAQHATGRINPGYLHGVFR
ncbi:hypothetical protein [Sagittula salina]|uniref:Uncharacterized protein n=1 Tax=Sagittula salina TaxID=2820268 RepID=A0A940S5H1_9RHOB|nr:hypothetical protein [Sagittula salina]MBP0484985.1 hypothetical protein [Sagittula salina]